MLSKVKYVDKSLGNSPRRYSVEVGRVNFQTEKACVTPGCLSQRSQRVVEPWRAVSAIRWAVSPWGGASAPPPSPGRHSTGSHCWVCCTNYFIKNTASLQTPFQLLGVKLYSTLLVTIINILALFQEQFANQKAGSSCSKNNEVSTTLSPQVGTFIVIPTFYSSRLIEQPRSSVPLINSCVKLTPPPPTKNQGEPPK